MAKVNRFKPKEDVTLSHIIPFNISMISKDGGLTPKFNESDELVVFGTDEGGSTMALFDKKTDPKTDPPKVEELVTQAVGAAMSTLTEDVKEEITKISAKADQTIALERKLDLMEQAVKDSQNSKEQLEARAQRSEEKLEALVKQAEKLGLNKGKIGGNVEADESEQERVFKQALRGEYRNLSPDDMKILKQATYVRATGAPGSGDHLILDKWNKDLERVKVEQSVLRMAGATVLKVNQFRDFKWPTATAGTELTETAESAASTDVGETFDEIVFAPIKSAGKVVATEEWLDDNFLGTQIVVMRGLGDRVLTYENSRFTTGNGTTQPQGVTVGASDSGVTAASGFLTIPELIDASFSGLGAAYWTRPNFGILTSTAQFSVWQQASGNDQLLWEPDTSRPYRFSFRGMPVFISEHMPATTGTRGTVIGDFSEFVIVDYLRPAIKFFDHTLLDTGEVAWRVLLRYDSNVVQPAALTYATLGTIV